ncbi:uncharacterized protein [Bos mutus]|uniref:uncharacterized protein isoform X2 n=1 Tax=Bos mutus TaxID=72004 RepID=UPI0038B6356F
MAAARPNGCSAWAAGRGQGGCAAAAGWLGRRRRRYEARARGPGREEEEDVARGGEMAAENKPEDDHGNSNSSHVKIFLPKKLLECLPKCSSLPKERHRWNTNEIMS